MKKVLALAAVAGIMTASAAFAGSIVTSKHNLSSTGTGTVKGTATNTSQICVYCHAPHNAHDALPLWNRVNPTASLYKLYSGVNMQSRQFATGFSSDSTSLFCMSCHDGTNTTLGGTVHNQGAIIRGAASGAASNPLVPASVTLAGGNADFSTDLTKTHPVNFPVPATNNSQNDLWLSPAAGAKYMGGAPGNIDYPLFKATGRDGGSARALECGSCHAVHDSTNSPFLRYTMNGSALCLGCHNK